LGRFDVLADMFLGSLFDERELRKEREVVLEEIRMYDDAPEEVLADLFARTLWRGANLGDPTIGFASTVAAIERDDVVAWHRARYVPGTVLVTAAGNLEHDALAALVERAFAGFGGAAEVPAPERPAFVPDVAVRQDDTEQAYALVGMPGLGMRDERRYALSVLDTILGGGASSRLFQAVREERGLAYEISSFLNAYREAGLFGISFGTAPERFAECLEVVVAEVDRLLAHGIRDDELTRAREHLKGNMTLVLESTANRMSRLVRNAIVHGRQISAEEVEARFDAVTRADVAELAHELLAPARRGLCVLGPLDPADIRGSVLG
jgi:predicted Zn-dependent peptidase